jgi:hypothetical protein
MALLLNAAIIIQPQSKILSRVCRQRVQPESWAPVNGVGGEDAPLSSLSHKQVAA